MPKMLNIFIKTGLVTWNDSCSFPQYCLIPNTLYRRSLSIVDIVKYVYKKFTIFVYYMN